MYVVENIGVTSVDFFSQDWHGRRWDRMAVSFLPASAPKCHFLGLDN